MEKLRALALIAFAVAAGLIWLPFHTMVPLKATGWTDPKPAGEIRGDFILDQQVKLKPNGVGVGEAYCFGIRFATYQRRNTGRVVVEWTQKTHRQQWSIRAGTLLDNKFRYFCPDLSAASTPAPSFTLRISGVNGTAGKSATVWLVSDRSLGTAALNGQSTGKGVSLELVKRTRTTVPDMLATANGAFLMAWACTLLLGILLIGYGRTAKDRSR